MMKCLKVYVVVISHRHGLNTDASRTYEGAEKIAADYARQFWDERANEDIESYEGLSDSDVIAAYFEDHQDEWFEIQLCEV